MPWRRPVCSTKYSRLVARGRVKRAVGTTVIATGPAVPVGALCHIESAEGPVPALVTGFVEDGLLLQPYERTTGVRPGALVTAVADRWRFLLVLTYSVG